MRLKIMNNDNTTPYFTFSTLVAQATFSPAKINRQLSADVQQLINPHQITEMDITIYHAVAATKLGPCT